MSIMVKAGGGSGGNKYTGPNPLTIGADGYSFDPKTLLKDGLTILNGVNGEDLTATEADMALAITELQRMVARKISENRGEGAYVWKKYTLPVTITMTQQNAGTNPTTFKMTSNNVDLSTVDVSYFIGLTGTYTVSSSSASFEIKKDGLYMGTSLRGALTYNPSTQVLSCAGNIGSICTWVCNTKNDFIEYVVNDSEFAYPNDGEQDGYYYEMGAGLSPEMFGCTKFAVDKFTFSSNTATNTAVNHSLGVTPKFAFILQDSINPNTYYSRVQLMRAANINADKALSSTSYTAYYGLSNKAVTNNGATSSATATTFTLGYQYMDYTAGVEYTLITMA